MLGIGGAGDAGSASAALLTGLRSLRHFAALPTPLLLLSHLLQLTQRSTGHRRDVHLKAPRRVLIDEGDILHLCMAVSEPSRARSCGGKALVVPGCFVDGEGQLGEDVVEEGEVLSGCFVGGRGEPGVGVGGRLWYRRVGGWLDREAGWETGLEGGVQAGGQAALGRMNMQRRRAGLLRREAALKWCVRMLCSGAQGG